MKSCPTARPRRYAESVCCTRAALTLKSVASVGSAGRYMSMASGPIAITSPRTSVSRATDADFEVRAVIISYLVRNSAFDAKNLLERVHDLDEVGLVRHYLVDVLIGAGNLVQHALVLATDDALRLHFQVG